MKRAAIYLRVSTDEQAEFGYSIQSQHAAAEKYAGQHGLNVETVISDDGQSGAKLARPGLDKLRLLIDQGKLDAVIVHAPDRLTRKLGHSLLLREEFQQANIELHFCNQGKVENTPEATMQQNITAVFADYWRAKIVESSRRGRIAKAAAGKWPCDGNPAYGYRKEGKAREAHLVIDEFEASIVRRIYDMHLGPSNGKPMTLQAIAAALTVEGIPPPNRGGAAKRDGSRKGRGWYRATVRNILTHRRYIGQFSYAGYDIHLPDLAIISEDVFELAQKKRRKNRARSDNSRKYNTLLAGHISCSCGRAMVVDPMSKGRYLYYKCSMSGIAPHLDICHEKRVRGNDEPGADRLVWEWLYDLLTDEDKLEKGLRELQTQHVTNTEEKQARLETVKTLIQDIKMKIEQLARKYAEEKNKVISEAIYNELKLAGNAHEALTAEKSGIEAELIGQRISEADVEVIKAMAQQVRGELNDASFELKRQIMNILDVKIELQKVGEKRGLKCTCSLILNKKLKNSLIPMKSKNLSVTYLSTTIT